MDKISVSDPYTYFMDPDPGYFFNMDPGPDPGKKKTFSNGLKKLGKIIC